MRQIEFLHRTSHADIAETAFFFEASRFFRTLLAGEHAFLNTHHKDQREFEPLGTVQCHQLHGFVKFIRLFIAGLQRGMCQKGGQRAHIQIFFGRPE